MSTTIILGAGIIGTSTAYYLAKHQPPSSVHLVEVSSELFASASGYAGGFLAKDWFSPASASLGALSFEEHRKLAEKDNGVEKWGYAQSTSISLSPPTDSSKEKVDVWCRDGASRAEAAAGDLTKGVAPPWLKREDGDAVEVISNEGTVAQVDPLQLSHHLLKKCLNLGVQLHQPANAISILTDVRNEVSSICIADTRTSTETDIPCTRIIITSVSQGTPPEIFSRLGGQIYLAGLNSATEPLPELATDSKGNLSKSAIQKLRDTAREILAREGAADDGFEVTREGLCFRPVTEDGLPIIGRIPDEQLGASVRTRPGAEGGVYLAAGHGPWGISMSLGTGKVLAELVQGRELSADISSLGLRD
ncbi:hypothetical protein PG995_003636 [Apiospora arundinis]